jgi:xanthine dehydrogenase accessory factor
LSHVSVFRHAVKLAEQGRAYALATVVGRRAPSSSQLGQKALIDDRGAFFGWLGGSCIEPVVRKEAREAMRDGRPRLIVLAPDGRSGRPDAIVYPMTCHSGGTVEIYLEPQLPASLLLLYGSSPVIHALAGLGEQAGYRVSVLEEPRARETLGDDSRDPARSCAVVATLGEWDTEAIEDALRAGATYVGLIASPRRTAEERRRLLERGWHEDQLSPLVGPAGLDIGARAPAEIAISVLAELIQRRAEAEGAAGAPRTGDPELQEAAVAIDPICGMEVSKAGARHTLEHEGAVHFFCCAGCRETFAQQLAAAAGT